MMNATAYAMTRAPNISYEEADRRHQALTHAPDIGLLLPCNLVVREIVRAPR